jgi:transcriptional regulator with XRE-family HTH domain
MATNLPKQPEPDQDRRAFGQALRQLRNRAGLTQQQLAERAATDNTYISHAEAGRFGVGWDSVMRLLRAVNATPSELAAEIERQERQPED